MDTKTLTREEELEAYAGSCLSFLAMLDKMYQAVQEEEKLTERNPMGVMVGGLVAEGFRILGKMPEVKQ